MILQQQPQQHQPHLPYKIPKLVLLDRDGVINQDVGAPGVLHPQQLILTPKAGTAIARLKQAGCFIAIITNQSCVGKGLITPFQLDQIHDHLQELLLQEHPQAQIDQIYSCTTFYDPNANTHEEEDDPRRKPQPGMIHEALADFGITTTQECCWVGDTATDLQAATAATIEQRYLVSTGYGQGLMKGLPPPLPPCPPTWIEPSSSNPTVEMDPFITSSTPFYYCQNLAHAVDWILEPTRL